MSKVEVRFPVQRRPVLLVAGPPLALLALLSWTSSGDAYQAAELGEESIVAERIVSPAIGEQILHPQNCLDLSDYDCVVDTLTPLLNQDLNDFERFLIYRLRGVAYFSQDRRVEAIEDFQSAINTGAASADERTALYLNIAQLYIVTNQYSHGIATFERAIRESADLTPDIAIMMAQAYAQAERYSEGIRYARLAFDTANPRERRHFDLLLHYFQQLDLQPEQLDLLHQMVERWPDDRNMWTSLVALLASTGDESGAFEANKLMYLNGMLTEEREIIRIAQFYSYFEYPYRGASILEREMNAGRVSQSAGNLEILANLWRQAREFETAIPVLLQTAETTQSGEDYLMLAEALYQVGRLEEAETAFEQALQRDGFSRAGDAWALLGTVRFEMNQRERALDAFDRCAELPESQRTCGGWARFIRAELRQVIIHPPIRERIVVEECRNTIGTQLEVETLTGDANSVDEDGRIFITVPKRCESYFNRYGEQIGGPGFIAAEARTESTPAR